MDEFEKDMDKCISCMACDSLSFRDAKLVCPVGAILKPKRFK